MEMTALNSETLNRYVLIVVGLFGVLLYAVAVFTGVSRLTSGKAKPKRQRKRMRAVGRARFRDDKNLDVLRDPE